MAEIDMTVVSSKGQVVIPARLRKGFGHGQRLIAIRQNDMLILRKAQAVDAEFADDLKAAKRADAALDGFRKGKFHSKPKDDFLAELEKW